MTRRDQLYLVGRRMDKCTKEEAAYAWARLSEGLIHLGDVDLPKFKHLLHEIRRATIEGRFSSKPIDESILK